MLREDGLQAVLEAVGDARIVMINEAHDDPYHRWVIARLAEALAPYGVEADMIPTAFNLFMNVPVDGATGRLAVEPPVSKSGDHISMRALSPLIIGLTACSAYDSCGGTFKPIDYAIDRPIAGAT